MNELELKNKLDNLMKDPEWVKKLEAMETVDELAAMLQEQEIPVTADELCDAFEKLQKGGELDAEDLDNVSGGLIFTAGMGIAAMVGISVLCYGGAYAFYLEDRKFSKKKKK